MYSRPNHMIRGYFVSHPAGFPRKRQPLVQTNLTKEWLTYYIIMKYNVT